MALNEKQKRFCEEYLGSKRLRYSLRSSGMTTSEIPGNGYFVYILVDPLSDEIFYIGKGVKNRPYDHIAESKRSSSTNILKSNRIIFILSKGGNVGIYYLAIDLIESDSFKIESSFIKTIGTDNLTNISGGVTKHTAKEQALFNLSRIKPYENWIRDKPQASDYEKELYWKTIEAFTNIAEFGFISSVEAVTVNGKNELREKIRL